MDWRVTGRTGKFHVKEYEATKQMPVWLIVDTSASMLQSSQPLSKYAWAVQLAGGIGLAALDRISPVGIMGCGERELQIQPSLSRVRIFLWLHQLRTYQTGERTQLGKTLRKLGTVLQNRAAVIVLSDFHDPDALPALKLLTQKHDCMALHLQDPAERGDLRAGVLRGSESETGSAFVSRGRDQFFDWERVAGEYKSGGIDQLFLPTDEAFVPRLRWFLEKRGMLGKGAR
jgi:uncharacterized protein (DUF58 family)